MARPVPLLAVLLAACSSPQPPAAVVEAPLPAINSPASVEPALLGRWRIAAIDGQAPLATSTGEPATLVFTDTGHGGNAGCNGFGGYGLEHEGRWYAGTSMATQMSCGSARNEQESAVMELLASGPALAWKGPERVDLITFTRRLALERSGAPAPPDPQAEGLALIGTRWRFGSVDGGQLSFRRFREAPQLIVEGERYRLDTPCSTAESAWRQTGQGRARFAAPVVVATRACSAAEQSDTRALLAALTGAKRYVTGPNGEFVLAGDGRWLTGEGVRVGAAEAALVAGRWRREDAPGAQAPGGGRPPELVLTERSFSLWNGCNATEGLVILFERRLITRGSGTSTLANCPSAHVDRAFAQVIGSQPRVGLLADGGLLLSSPAGELRLRKVGAIDPKSGGVRRTLGHPMRFTLLGHGGGTLEITGPARYRLSLPCGAITGGWRSSARNPEGSYRFGPDREPEGCHGGTGASRLADLFRGNVEVAIGPNRDIALFAGRFGSVAATLER